MHLHIAILLSTYNGGRHLDPLLESIVLQTGPSFTLFIRDDGSNDGTPDLISRRASDSDRIVVLPNEPACHAGPLRSYQLLLEHVLQLDRQVDYVMFAQQGEIWQRHKLTAALKHMLQATRHSPEKPALVHTDLQPADEQWRPAPRRPLHLFPRIGDRDISPLGSFLLHNPIHGGTIMINRNLAALALPFPREAVQYDWWIGMVAAAFGQISYLSESATLWQQESREQVRGWKQTVRAFVRWWQEPVSMERQVKQAEAFLQQYGFFTSIKQEQQLANFVDLMGQGGPQSMGILLYRSIKSGNISSLGQLLSFWRTIHFGVMNRRKGDDGNDGSC